MFANFLPPTVVEIQDSDAIALLQQLQRQAISVPLKQGTAAIATAYVRDSPKRSPPSKVAPMLLLPGFDSSLLEFRRLLPLLAIQRETWALDWLGVGFTACDPALAVQPRSIRQHLLRVLETWIGQPVVLVGASLGGAVAIDFTLHYPDWVQSLVLIDSVGFSGSFPIGPFLPHFLIDWGADWLHFRKQAALTAAMAWPLVNPMLVDTLRCSLLHQAMPGWKAAIASFTQSGGYAQLGDRITQIQPPTLIVWGEADDTLGTGDATQFERAISNSQLVWIPQAGHAPHLDQPQLVAAHLLAFTSRNHS